MGGSTVSSGWSNHFIEFVQIFNIRLPLWLAYDHWTALETAQKLVARDMVIQTNPGLVQGTQEFLKRVADVLAARTPELIARAHALVGAPHLFGVEFGFNLPALCIALIITAILVLGIQESATFNALIVFIKVSVVLFIIALGFGYIERGNWGHDWHSFAPMGFSGISAGAAYIFFAYIGFDAVSTTAQEAKNPQRDLPIGIIASLLICTILYILVAGVLTGMVPWNNVNIEAPLVVAFLDRGLVKASYLITAGALAGLTSVMLVMLLGQTRVLYSMANDGLLPRSFFAKVHPRFRTPYKNTILVGLLAGIIGSITPIDKIANMVNIGTLLAFVIVCAAVIVLRHHYRCAAALPNAMGAAGTHSGRHSERLHDVEPGLLELDAIGRLAGDRPGGLFWLQPQAQPRAARRVALRRRFVPGGTRSLLLRQNPSK